MPIHKPELWIISELFFPEDGATARAITEYATTLRDRFDVHVICASAKARAPLAGITIHHAPMAHHGNSLPVRIVKAIVIAIVFFIMTSWHCRKNSYVLCSTNPVFLVPTVAMAKIIRRFHLSILVHDVFPDNTIAANILKSRHSIIYRLLESIYCRAYRQADRLITLGRDMKYLMQHKIGDNDDKKTLIIENFAQPSVFYCPEERPSQGPVVIQYAGNIGRVQGLLSFLELFHIAANKATQFDIYGSGAAEQQLKDFVRSHNIPNVSFKGPFTSDEQCRILNKCDIALISLGHGMLGLGVPSKFYNIMAAGSPILYIGDIESEVRHVVADNDIGFCFEPNDSNTIVQFLKTLSRPMMQSLSEEIRIREQALAGGQYSKNAIHRKILSAFTFH